MKTRDKFVNFSNSDTAVSIQSFYDHDVLNGGNAVRLTNHNTGKSIKFTQYEARQLLNLMSKVLEAQSEDN